MVKNILLMLVLGLIIGCSTEQQAKNSSQPGATESQKVASLLTTAEASEALSFNLVFFLDPNGGPCKRQDAILLGMSDELNRKVNIRYVKTTVPAHRNLFYQYGIRGLPTLLLADSSGKEIKRMTPGIHNAANIRALIQSIERS